MNRTVLAIPLEGGMASLIDKADETVVAGFNWKLSSLGYALAQRGNLYIYLHRLIAGAGPDELVDHINMDRLDNRSANLRIATKKLNAANRGADRRRLGTTSRFKGVSWKSDRSRWVAHIHVDGKTRYLGSFLDEDEAAIAYNEAALKTWGDFARLNIIGGDAQ